MEVVKNEEARRVNLTKMIRPIDNDKKSELANLLIKTFGEKHADKIRERLDQTEFFFMGSRNEYIDYVNEQIDNFFQKLMYDSGYNDFFNNIYYCFVEKSFKQLAILLEKVDAISNLNPENVDDMVKILDETADYPWVIGLPVDICRTPEWKRAVQEATKVKHNTIEYLFTSIKDNLDMVGAENQARGMLYANSDYFFVEDLEREHFGLQRKHLTEVLNELSSWSGKYISLLKTLQETFKMPKSQKEKYLKILLALCGDEIEKKATREEMFNQFIASVEKKYNVSFDVAKKQYQKSLYLKDKPLLADLWSVITPEKLITIYGDFSYYASNLAELILEIKHYQYDKNVEEITNELIEELELYREECKNLFDKIDSYWETKQSSGVKNAVINTMEGAGKEDKKYEDIFLGGVNDGTIDFTKNFCSVYINNIDNNLGVRSFVMLDIGSADDTVLIHESIHSLGKNIVGVSKKHSLVVFTNGLDYGSDHTDFKCPDPQKFLDYDFDAASLVRQEQNSDKVHFIEKNFNVSADVLGYQYIDEVVTEWLACKAENRAQKNNQKFLKNSNKFYCIYVNAFKVMEPFFQKFEDQIIDAKISNTPFEFVREIGFDNYSKLGLALQDFLEAKRRRKSFDEICAREEKLNNIIYVIVNGSEKQPNAE